MYAIFVMHRRWCRNPVPYLNSALWAVFCQTSNMAGGRHSDPFTHETDTHYQTILFGVDGVFILSFGRVRVWHRSVCQTV
jgi:hypothetical protein